MGYAANARTNEYGDAVSAFDGLRTEGLGSVCREIPPQAIPKKLKSLKLGQVANMTSRSWNFLASHLINGKNSYNSMTKCKIPADSGEKCILIVDEYAYWKQGGLVQKQNLSGS